MNLTNESSDLQQAIDEDRDDCQRADIADEEPEDSEDSCVCREGASVGEFIVDIGLLEPPSDEEDSQKASKGHEDI